MPQAAPTQPNAPIERGMLGVWKPRATPLGVSGDLVSRVLRARGIQSTDAFLSPSLQQLHDPSRIPNLDLAAERLLRAAREHEPIVIYGDYDVDGVSATAILYHTIRALAPGARVTTYVPHRLEEGYGLNSEAIAKLAGEGARVIVSVDCGITAVAPARVAREAGVDLIITDHHTPPTRIEDLPEAFACVHPRLPGSAYPFGDLCGAGVAFKLAWRLATLDAGSERVSESIRGLLLDMLALASLGVVADVVPLLGENRVMARFGLSRLKHVSNVGLRALIGASGLAGEKVSAEDVGFRLGPRLNACGRLGHAREAVELLLTSDEGRAREIAESLARLNDQRRATELRIFEQACELAEASGMTAPHSRAIVLAHREWHQGVVGIVCSRLVEKYRRPTILFQDHGEECHGSGRSLEGFSLYDAIARASEHLVTFGGHDMAAGLRLRTSSLDAFARAFSGVCAASLREEDLVAVRTFDADALLAELTPANVHRLQALAPFGRDNPEPCLRVAGLRLSGGAETFGGFSRHLQLRVVGEAGGPALRCIAWNRAELARRLPHGCRIDALLTPKISTFTGAARVECEVRDVALREDGTALS